jgi:uncharacterized 2Fe-2S/4Fe-4S cluster protein (DUF4445 family)
VQRQARGSSDRIEIRGCGGHHGPASNATAIVAGPDVSVEVQQPIGRTTAAGARRLVLVVDDSDDLISISRMLLYE